MRSAQFCIPREFDDTCMINIMADLMVMVRPGHTACECPGFAPLDRTCCACNRLQTVAYTQPGCSLDLVCGHVVPSMCA